MSELVWSDELPTVQGAYWRRDRGKPHTAMIVWVVTVSPLSYCRLGASGTLEAYAKGEWSGPIPLPMER